MPWLLPVQVDRARCAPRSHPLGATLHLEVQIPRSCFRSGTGRPLGCGLGCHFLRLRTSLALSSLVACMRHSFNPSRFDLASAKHPSTTRLRLDELSSYMARWWLHARKVHSDPSSVSSSLLLRSASEAKSGIGPPADTSLQGWVDKGVALPLTKWQI